MVVYVSLFVPFSLLEMDQELEKFELGDSQGKYKTSQDKRQTDFLKYAFVGTLVAWNIVICYLRIFVK
jgi:hypothetical protein